MLSTGRNARARHSHVFVRSDFFSGVDLEVDYGPAQPYGTSMGKHIAKVKLTLTKRTVEALMPEDQPWIPWDDKVTGFGGRVYCPCRSI